MRGIRPPARTSSLIVLGFKSKVADDRSIAFDRAGMGTDRDHITLCSVG
jgi:hypothetical protein